MRRMAAAVLALLLLAAPARAASPFDGSWDVSVVCPPEKKGALGYNYEFVATVRDGALHGQRGIKGAPSSLTLTGNIGPDGTASLLADGFTGDPEYALGQVKKATPYSYPVAARFEGRRGSGNRVGGRICSYSFSRR